MAKKYKKIVVENDFMEDNDVIEVFVTSFLLPELIDLENKKVVVKAIARARVKWNKIETWKVLTHFSAFSRANVAR